MAVRRPVRGRAARGGVAPPWLAGGGWWWLAGAVGPGCGQCGVVGAVEMLRAGNLKYFLGGAALTGAPSMYMLHQDVWKSQQL